MNDTLFPARQFPDYLFDLAYKGPSFNGTMEISALKNEIIGLEDAILIATRILSKHKKINFSPKDVQILIEAFQKGSFKKRVKIVFKSVKSLNDYQGIINLGVLIVMVFTLVQQKGATELKTLSPQLMTEIGDQVKIELLQNSEFIKSVTNVINPLEQTGDEFTCGVPGNTTTTIKFEDKKQFTALADDAETTQEIDGDHFEILQGWINRVDLDATKRHLGFKVDGEGNSIPATLDEHLRTSIDMHGLLGHWVEINVTTTYRGGLRDHVFIQSLKLIEQRRMEFKTGS
ncbi:MAG: hypothetical protein PHD72_03845 [Patescibacteria group bacterium]|nr:hypothetical protein [Patescibacteria group bacterium]